MPCTNNELFVDAMLIHVDDFEAQAFTFKLFALGRYVTKLGENATGLHFFPLDPNYRETS